jgi:hypothetical protein
VATEPIRDIQVDQTWVEGALAYTRAPADRDCCLR